MWSRKSLNLTMVLPASYLKGIKDVSVGTILELSPIIWEKISTSYHLEEIYAAFSGVFFNQPNKRLKDLS